MNPAASEKIRRDVEEVVKGSSQLLAPLKGEKILITGGTGFMGTWLVETLAYLNDQLGYGIRIQLLAKHASQFKDRAPHLAGRKDVSLIDKNAKDIIAIDDDITYVIHAAANPDNRVHSSDPLRIMSSIARGTETVLEAAARLPDLRKLLYVSSGLVYGPQPMSLERMPETYIGGPDCASITSVYSEAKRYSETLCAAYRSQYKIPLITARPFAFIGPYQLLDKPWAVNNFINDALRGSQIGILGDPATVRSYMYPSDMAFWLLVMLASERTGVYNLGSPEGISLEGLALKIASHFTPTPEIVTAGRESRRGGPSRFVPDVSAAQSDLGLTVKVGIDEAVRRTLLWHRGNSK